MGRKITKPTGEDLKTLLWETINDVRGGTTSAKDANAISAGARGICDIVKMEMMASKMSKSKRITPATTKFISGR